MSVLRLGPLVARLRAPDPVHPLERELPDGVFLIALDLRTWCGDCDGDSPSPTLCDRCRAEVSALSSLLSVLGTQGEGATHLEALGLGEVDVDPAAGDEEIASIRYWRWVGRSLAVTRLGGPGRLEAVLTLLGATDEGDTPLDVSSVLLARLPERGRPERVWEEMLQEKHVGGALLREAIWIAYPDPASEAVVLVSARLTRTDLLAAATLTGLGLRSSFQG